MPAKRRPTKKNEAQTKVTDTFIGKRKYHKMTVAEQEKLLHHVFKLQKTIYQASQDLGYNYSNAKHIVRRFKTSGQYLAATEY